MLTKANTSFSYLDVEEEAVMNELTRLQREHSYRTIPMIFIDGKFIGGYRELYQLVEQRKIDLGDFR